MRINHSTLLEPGGRSEFLSSEIRPSSGNAPGVMLPGCSQGWWGALCLTHCEALAPGGAGRGLQLSPEWIPGFTESLRSRHQPIRSPRRPSVPHLCSHRLPSMFFFKKRLFALTRVSGYKYGRSWQLRKRISREVFWGQMGGT